ncbi:MAG: glycosyltransferase, partial [Cyanobacteria bacterium]|nr:glycosyltransferase [Cyanobacteriota bacterium]
MTRPAVLIVLHTLAAEGCPQLALQLSRHWLEQGLEIQLLCLEPWPCDLCAEFEALGVTLHTASLGRGLARYPRLLWLSWRLCRSTRADAVLSFPLGWHALIAWGARLAGVPRICAHVGNLPPVWTGRAFRRFRWLVQLGRPVTHRLLCCSDYIRAATVRDFGLRPEETATVFNACDLPTFGPLPTVGLLAPLAPNNSPCIGMVARLELHKDQPTLIRAAAEIRDRGLPLTVWLIGEGSQRPGLEALIHQLGLADRVKLLGSRRDIPALLHQ